MHKICFTGNLNACNIDFTVHRAITKRYNYTTDKPDSGTVGCVSAYGNAPDYLMALSYSQSKLSNCAANFIPVSHHSL
jgi:hypothetical protein